ncbi:class B sortase [Ruminococcus albus]|uniref:Sortase family protein n=1 Tax=Ruminococcus albus TaxID=1264 RepID=A0A1I1M6N1_RUMAL|nr:class B sortase [Ruminococcus albus]SFC77320.1 Sortase family protein [Ruminococcus albus]
MKLLNKIASAANTVLMLAAAGAGVLMLAFGAYVLYDIRYTNQNAYISQDLLQYRPKVAAEEEGTETFAELRKINPDVVGWLELFDTHINYPLVQGRDDLEYLNKDIYGDSTLSGSIYLASENERDFSDRYNLIYGHHMDNGAMFGDIRNFLDKDYFDSHQEGLLQTENGTYLIKVFACAYADAYDNVIYNISKDADKKFPELREFLSEHAVQHREMPQELSDWMLIGLSTCTDVVTNGRIVLFVSAGPLSSEDAVKYMERSSGDVPTEGTHRLPLGYFTDSDHWALLNLLCVAETFLILLPVTAIRKKYRQISYSKKLAKKLEETDCKDSHENYENNDTEERRCSEENEEICKQLRRFTDRMHIGMIVECVLLIVSIVVFLMTEDLTKKMTLSDKWTGLMILIAAVSLLIDHLTFCYKGKLPNKEELTTQQKDDKVYS